jgi:hypothetical protein
MTTKHTPGPWKVEKGRDKTHPYNITGEGFDLARCVTADDAALIASVHDLLEALREIIAINDEDQGTFRKRGGTRRGLSMVVAHEAIAKATGEQ